jgi:apolipoprotein D and lipocalin family protein
MKINIFFKRGGKASKTSGTASIPNAAVQSKFILKLSILSGLFKTSGNYWVVDTDYDNYSLVYSCKSYLGIMKSEAVWFLSRKRTLDEVFYGRLTEKLSSFSKSLVSKLIVQDQTNCSN